MTKKEDWTKEQKKLDIELKKIKTLSNEGSRDRLFAEAYEKSGCTQQQIADVHGCSQSRVSQMLTFLRFLNWFYNYSNNDEKLKGLAESRFRGAWLETQGNESHRFEICVGKLMVPFKKANIATLIYETFGDGKKFTAKTAAKEIDRPIEGVKTTLRKMKSGEIANYAVESRKFKDTCRYQILAHTPGKRRVPISMIDYSKLVLDIESGLKKVLSVLDGHTWASTSPEMIRGEIDPVLRRLQVAKQFMKDKSVRTPDKDVPHPKTDHKPLSVKETQK